MKKYKAYFINPSSLMVGFVIFITIMFRMLILNSWVLYFIIGGLAIWFLYSIQYLRLGRSDLIFKPNAFTKYEITFTTSEVTKNEVQFVDNGKIYSFFLDEGFELSSLIINLNQGKEVEIIPNADSIFKTIAMFYRTNYVVQQNSDFEDILDS